MPDTDDLDLGENDYEEEPEGFPPPERRIVTNAYDLSLNTLVEQWDDQILVVPPMQREFVWDRGRASRLMESLMLNIPVPPVFLAENEDATFDIIDGQQRIHSIVTFMKNEYALYGLRMQQELARLRFHQLPQREQRFLRSRVIRAIIVGIESHPQMRFEIFRRLNTGAVALNAQEVRNALNQGLLNDLLKTLETDARFRQCMGSERPRRRMVDQELVLRFFALSDGLRNYRPPLDRLLNNFMDGHRRATTTLTDKLRDRFLRAAEFNARLFPAGAFRPFGRNGKPTERSVNRALYDAQMIPTIWLRPADISESIVEQIHENGSKLFHTFLFRDAIQRATGDRSRTFTRIHAWAKLLEDSGVDLDIPAWIRTN